MKRTCLALSLLVMAALPGPAAAVFGTIDDVPAATLLLPYFEVDIQRADGINTLFSINNASSAAILAHVTVWSDQSVAVLDFDVYLTGYDVQTISLRDIFVDGKLPRTASLSQDPNDTISPVGIVSQDIDFASCTALPYPTSNAVSASFRAHLQAWLQGNPSPATGNCAGSKKNDGILRGYITVDTVNACNLFFPADCPFYQPFLTHQNVLWGDYFYVHPAKGSAIGETLVHIESCPACFEDLPEEAHSFYTRYCTNPDVREPLATTFAARYLNQGAFSNTDFLVWREANSTAAAYPCTLQGPPSWHPLETAQIVVFDENEQPVTVEPCPSGDPTCEQEITIPNEAQRVNVRTDLEAPFDFGWIYLNLQHPDTAYGDPFAQAWVTVNMSAGGLYSVGFDAVQLDNANDPVTTRIPE